MALEAPASDVAVNASGPAPITTLQLATMVAEIAGRADLVPELVAPDPGKVRLTSGGAFEIVHTAARDAIGWEPQVDMREGLRRLLAWRDAAQAKAAG
jgi:UDP-glucose 4-epimerase